MIDEPKPESPEDDAEFERVLRNLVNTPHKPHVNASKNESADGKKERGAPKSAPKVGKLAKG